MPTRMCADIKSIMKFTGMRLPGIPKVRGYIVPWAKDWVLIDRDYSQQELRILAHYEEGSLFQQYQNDPWTDVHDYVHKAVIARFGIDYGRPHIKAVNFGTLYGMGVPGLMVNTGLSREEAATLRDSVMAILNGVPEINDDMRRRMICNEPFRTWGGREYYCRPPVKDKKTGRLKTLDYQMINVLIQGSAGDMTKEAWVNLADNSPPTLKTYLSVHDEFLCSCPKSEIKNHMQILRESMESVKLDVPLLSEGKISYTNWAECRAYDKKGVLV